MTRTLVWRGSRQQLLDQLRTLPATLAGDAPDPLDLGRGLRLRVGVAALSKIQQWFIVKARGGTDPAGLSWPKLSPKTIAYGRRFGPGETTALKRAAGLGKQHSKGAGTGQSGLLTADQQKRWRAVFAQRLAWLSAKGMSGGAAKAAAASMAWAQLKREGAKTKLEVYGNRTVEILRDSGILLSSLSPGLEDKPSGAPGQVFDASTPGAVIVGSVVPYARQHHEGIPGRLPQRRLWPDPKDWPQAAWDDLAAAAKTGVERAVELTVRAGARP